MLNYNKNKLINKCLVKYYETFAHTLDTADYVPEKYNKKILAYIFKNMKKQFRKLDREDRKYQRARKVAEREKVKAEKNKNSNVEEKENDKEKQQISDRQKSNEQAENNYTE